MTKKNALTQATQPNKLMVEEQVQADARCSSCKKPLKQQQQQRRLTYESRENLDSFSLSILSEISQTEHVRALNFEKEILNIVLV